MAGGGRARGRTALALRRPHPLRAQRPRRLPAGAGRSCWRRWSRPERAPSPSRCTSPTDTRRPTTRRWPLAEASDGRLVPSAGSIPTAMRWPRRGAASTPALAASSCIPAPSSSRWTSPRSRTLVSLAEERRVPILIHAGRGIPAFGRDTLDLAERHPGAHLILAHAAVSDIAWLWRLMPEHPNLFIDTSWWNPADLIALFCLVPPGQILWASDSPLRAAAQRRRVPPSLRAGSRPRPRGDRLDRRRPDRAHPGRRGAGRRRAAAWPSRRARPSMERVCSHLLTAVGRAFAEGDPTESVALARLACDLEGEHGAAGEEVIHLLDLAERHTARRPPAAASHSRCGWWSSRSPWPERPTWRCQTTTEDDPVR